MAKLLIFRSGAFGDNVIITPVIRYLKERGHTLIVVTSKRGMEVFKDNPNIERLVQHKEETPIDKLAENIEWLRKKFKCEKVLDFSESIEVALSQHPRSPSYKLSKPERLAKFNRNFYEYAFEHARGTAPELFNEKETSYTPELFFTKHEIDDAQQYLDVERFNLLIGMSGSGNNKAWPWTQNLIYKIIEEYPEVHVVTVGDARCKLIEPITKDRITNLSGEIPMRTAMALTGLVNLVIAPDTGIIHAAGCYDTPKLCLLGHNTKECITKHFENDHSVEADSNLAPCSPCLFLVYDMTLQCPINLSTKSSVCMSDGIPLETVFEKFKEIYVKSEKRF